MSFIKNLFLFAHINKLDKHDYNILDDLHSN